jgi:putative MATE family efflux protein
MFRAAWRMRGAVSTEAEALVQPHSGIGVQDETLNARIIKLAWPVILERLSISVLSAVDAILVGRYVGADGIAAVGVAFLLFWVPLSGALAIDVGSTAIIARDVGAGDRSRVQAGLHAAIISGLGWGLSCMVVIFALAPLFMRAMGADSDVQPLGVEYLRAGSLGLPFTMVFYAVAGSLRGMGNTWMSMVILIVANVLNAAVTFLLISGAAADLGVLAAGIGLASAGIASGVMAVGLLVSGAAPISLDLRRLWQTNRESFARLGRIGLPVGLEEAQFMLAFLVYTRVVSSLGTDQLAAHALALRSLEVAILPAFALGTAATALVGQSLGGGDPDRAEEVAKRVRFFALAALCALAVVQFVMAPYIVRIFVDDPDVQEIGTKCLRVFSLALPGMAIHASLSGALRGAGDTRFVLATFTFSAWCIRVPLAFLFAVVFGFSVPFVWTAAVTENWVRAGLTTWRFRSGKWKYLRV